MAQRRAHLAENVIGHGVGIGAAGARLLGDFGWSDVGRSFDGIHYAISKPSNDFTFVAAVPTRGLAATKAAIRSSWQHSLAGQLDLERDAQRELGRSQDYAEGVAAFTAKRAANFTGR